MPQTVIPIWGMHLRENPLWAFGLPESYGERSWGMGAQKKPHSLLEGDYKAKRRKEQGKLLRAFVSAILPRKSAGFPRNCKERREGMVETSDFVLGRNPGT